MSGRAGVTSDPVSVVTRRPVRVIGSPCRHGEGTGRGGRAQTRMGRPGAVLRGAGAHAHPGLQLRQE
ncbi:hypothetical protein FRACA_1890011 [Frankia canadensis]|uniref:Uncharacterized protein n=1 Tax=Frankia canadensis TaxID=1836972 RepID=A0A2I2KP20_9ACTN|nr:hypothetical protein FRACA_1890011 [Frankia canadensis]SOU54708.1 hypothetical protein FRACA_1890011 [Frankia canadensis]